MFLPHRYLNLAVLLVIGVFTQNASAEPTHTLRNNGDPGTQLDIVFLGDGYTDGEMVKYRYDVQQIVDRIFLQEPFREYQRYFNVHRIDVISQEPGADHPEIGYFVNTALDARYNCEGVERAICVNPEKVGGVISRSLTSAQANFRVVLVNDITPGGAALSSANIAVMINMDENANRLLHELGHLIAGLGDEYLEGGHSCSALDRTFPLNIWSGTGPIQWNHWINASTPIPTPDSVAGPGAYQGGLYCLNFYRPTYESKMRNSWRPFEQVNTELLVRAIYNGMSLPQGWYPARNEITVQYGNLQTFRVQVQQPLTHNLEIT